MNIRRAAFMAVLAVAVAALAVPLVGLRATASSTATSPKAVSAIAKAAAAKTLAANESAQQIERRKDVADGSLSEQAPAGKISAETLKALGLSKVANPIEAGKKLAAKMQSRKNKSGSSPVTIQSGQPTVLNARSALSAALMTTLGGRDSQFSEVTLIADWDGREDCAADREQKVDDFSFVESDPDVTLTRVGISEHTVANGFAENVYYYGDSLGNLWVGTDTNPGINVSANGGVDSLIQVNIPALVNTGASGGFTITPGSLGCTDDQVTVTGIAVQPVADLADFGVATCGTIGEVVYVSILDTEGCASNAANQPIRTRIFAFAFTDGVGAGAATPAGVRQVFSSPLANIAGVALDDDGSLYFHLVDLIQFTGGAIFKARPIPHVPVPGCSLRSTRVVPSIPTVGLTSVTPLSSASVRVTNYSSGAPGKAGTLTPLFGDIVAIATGGCNVLYAAVSPSFVFPGDATQGLFPAPAAFASGTPSMIISFADCAGAFDVCSGEATGSVNVNVGGTLPVGDGYADAPTATNAAILGVNNFRIFVLGNGPDLRPAAGGTAVVPGTLGSVLKLDMQIDYSAHSGLAVNEENTVFVISGGEPAGVGKSPSPMVGEVLCFEDACPADRRADFVDLRGNALPSPPGSGGNVGDGDSDRFDHIFYQAPVDQVTLTPTGLAGLARGFLRYPWRLAPSPIGPGVTLGVVKTRQADDDTDGPIIFEALDPGHQVAGGDDQNTPSRGDDDDGAGTPALTGALSGGFEFLFGGPVGTAACVWNGFFLNSNGNITFGVGDTSNAPTVPDFRQGPPRIAPAWADLNPSSCEIDLRTFPVQALGFANVNAFKVRWINVPRFGEEICTGDGGGASNTFSVTLYDDGTGIDENASQPLNPANPIGNNAVPFDLQEGPTDLRFTTVNLTNPVGSTSVAACPPRREGSGIFVFDYCRMDLLGTPEFPVITGYSIGNLDPLNPPGLCEVNLSVVALAADQGAFGVLTGGQIAAVGCNCCIGEGTEPTIFELFNEGAQAGTGSGGEITFAKPDFDLRFEGNDPAACQSTRQRDANRGRICFIGVGCAPLSNPQCQNVVPGTIVTTPNATGLVNAICQVPLNIVGCGFFPNEVTTICQGFEAETGVPLQRPGKTVSTAATLSCDTNGDGIAESLVSLVNVTPVSCNLVTATIPVLASMPGTGFPSACCGGPGVITVTTTFGAGDNNVFGPFTRTTTCAVALGTRAPVVFSVTPSNAQCAGLNDLLVTGACFCFTTSVGGVPTTFGVTSVIFQDASNPANTITVGVNPTANGQIKDLGCNPNLIDVLVNITSANAGKTFLVFVVNAAGTSRNLTGPVAGQPGAPCPTTGNEQGFQVTFKCNAPGTPGPGNTPVIATVQTCHLDRQATGQFFLDVTGTNIKEGATATVGGVTPKKIKVVAVEPGTSNPTTLRLIKKVCNGLPGNVIITNTVPNGGPSAPFNCTERCPSN